MDARGDGAAGIPGGDAPEVADAEDVGLRAGRGQVVEVVTIFPEVFAECGVVFAAK